MMKAWLSRLAGSARVVALLLAVPPVAAGCVGQRGPEPLSALALTQEETGVVAIGTPVEGDPTHVTLCSGALVAPNLVVTARHCISRSITSSPSCDAHGQSHNGAHLANDADPSTIAVYIGEHVRVDRDVPRAHGIRTLHPAGQVLCDSDVAFVVLDRSLAQDGVTVLPLRLVGSVASGDQVRPVGFGGGIARTLGDRVGRDGSTVLSIGPGPNSRTGAVLGPREFEVDRATCRGDSGGPALDALTGEIVGVVSRGGSCSLAGNHVYTRIDAYAGLARLALREASWLLVSQETVAMTH